ncbi:hypothetical protein [Rathayibacter festucae]|uniref:hypothetical protein n=1 Tax=Rathayibacter festucae TaxID=110937 RepID=UPI002A69BCDF|nr:hypothetical protein [Rathayibacter festucae]MDY0914506.1 hypothetical protein [Rathayibacter festucae]
MESDYERSEESAAREALATLNADRQMLADRLRAPVWYYPLLGIAAALVIGSPGAEAPGQSILVTFGCIGLVFLSLAHRRITGMMVTRMAGPRSLAFAVALSVVVVLLLGTSFALAAVGQSGWVWMTATAAFAATWIGGGLYDRAYDRELRRGH